MIRRKHSDLLFSFLEQVEFEYMHEIILQTFKESMKLEEFYLSYQIWRSYEEELISPKVID